MIIRSMSMVMAIFMAGAGLGIILGPRVTSADMGGAPGETLESVEYLDSVSAEVYVLTTDIGNLPDELLYDQSIDIGNIHATFLSNSMPQLRALVISGVMFDQISGGGASGGSSALTTVVERNHILFVVDRSSSEILEGLGYLGTMPVFDPLSREVVGVEMDESDNDLAAGTGVHFNLDDSPDESRWVFITPRVATDPDAIPIVLPDGGSIAPPGERRYNTITDNLSWYIAYSQQEEVPANRKCGDDKENLDERWQSLGITSYYERLNRPGDPLHNYPFCCPYSSVIYDTRVFTPKWNRCMNPPFDIEQWLLSDQPWVVCQGVLSQGTDMNHQITRRIPKPGSVNGVMPCIRAESIHRSDWGFPDPDDFLNDEYRCSRDEPDDTATFYRIQPVFEAKDESKPLLDQWRPNQNFVPQTTQINRYMEVTGSLPGGVGATFGASWESPQPPYIGISQSVGGLGPGQGPDRVQWEYTEPRLLELMMVDENGLCNLQGIRNWSVDPFTQRTQMQFDDSNEVRHGMLWWTAPDSVNLALREARHTFSLKRKYVVNQAVWIKTGLIGQGTLNRSRCEVDNYKLNTGINKKVHTCSGMIIPPPLPQPTNAPSQITVPLVSAWRLTSCYRSRDRSGSAVHSMVNCE